MNRVLSTTLVMNASGYVAGVKQASTATQDFVNRSTAAIQGQSQQLTRLGLAAAAMGAAIGLALRSAVRDSIAFNSALARSVTQIGVTRREVGALGEAALKMGATGRGAIELADALFFVQSAGQRGALALQTAAAAARAASIGLGETEVVADLATSAMNAYGDETLSASAATDIMVNTVREGKTSAEELTGAMGRILPIASEMGVSFDEVGAATAAMTRTGTDAATATTQLRSILTSLLNPAQQSEQALRDVGLSSEILRDTIQKDGLWQALMNMRTAIGDNDEALGQIFPNVRALAGFLDLTGANAEANAEIFANLSDSIGVAGEAFAEWSLTTEASQARFSAAMEAARISVGSDLEPTLRTALDTGTGLALMFQELPDEVRQFGTTTSAVLGGLFAAGGAGALALVGFAHLRTAMQTLNISALGLARFAFNPLTLAVAASAAALLVLANHKAEVARRAENLNALIGDSVDIVNNLSGAYRNLNDRQRESVGREILEENKDLLGILEQTDATLDDVVRAKLGDVDAQARLNQIVAEGTDIDQVLVDMGIRPQVSMYEELNRIIEEEIGITDEAARIQEQINSLFEDTQEVLPGVSTEVDGVAGSFDEAGQFTSFADEALKDYLDTLRAATDPVFALDTAMRSWDDAQLKVLDSEQALIDRQDELNELLDSGEASARDIADAERDVEDAQRDLDRATFDLTGALSDLEQAAIDGDLSFGEFENKLDSWVKQGLITKEEADAIRDRVDLLREAAEDMDDDYEVNVFETGMQGVITMAQNLKEAIENIPERRRIAISTDVTGTQLRASGITLTGATGGYVSGPGTGTSDSVPARLSNGEYVVKAAAVARYGRDMMSAINQMRYPSGGRLSTINVDASEADFQVADFNTLGTAITNAAFNAGQRVFGTGRVLPSGSYRIGRGPAAHGYNARDLPAPTGTPIFAAAAGIVSRAQRLGYSYGIHAAINHAGGWRTLYAHMSQMFVRAGQEVARGQRIGLVGSTGNSTGPHLHLEPDNPRLYDNGGVLPHGGVAVNLSGRPEAILNAQQFEAINRQLGVGGRGPVRSNGNATLNRQMEPRFNVQVFVGTREITDIMDVRISEANGTMDRFAQSGTGRI